jgi:hypothetical protein
MARKTAHLKQYQFQKGGGKKASGSKAGKTGMPNARAQFAKGAPKKSGRKR